MIADDLDDIDRDALQRAMSMAMRDVEMARTLNDKLARAQPWFDVARVAVDHCQTCALHLKPWNDAPCVVSADDPDERDKDGQALLRKMLDAGLSRYAPDPLRALERNAKRIARLKKKKPK